MINNINVCIIYFKNLLFIINFIKICYIYIFNKMKKVITKQKSKGIILIQQNITSKTTPFDFNIDILNEICRNQPKFFSDIKEANPDRNEFFKDHFNECLHYYGKYFNIILQKRKFSFYYDSLTTPLISGRNGFHVTNKLDPKNNVFIIKNINPNIINFNYNQLTDLLTDYEINVFKNLIHPLYYRDILTINLNRKDIIIENALIGNNWTNYKIEATLYRTESSIFLSYNYLNIDGEVYCKIPNNVYFCDQDCIFIKQNILQDIVNSYITNTKRRNGYIPFIYDIPGGNVDTKHTLLHELHEEVNLIIQTDNLSDILTIYKRGISTTYQGTILNISNVLDNDLLTTPRPTDKKAYNETNGNAIIPLSLAYYLLNLEKVTDLEYYRQIIKKIIYKMYTTHINNNPDHTDNIHKIITTNYSNNDSYWNYFMYMDELYQINTFNLKYPYFISVDDYEAIKIDIKRLFKIKNCTYSNSIYNYPCIDDKLSLFKSIYNLYCVDNTYLIDHYKILNNFYMPECYKCTGTLDNIDDKIKKKGGKSLNNYINYKYKLLCSKYNIK